MGTHFSFIFMGYDPYIEGLNIVFPWGTWDFLRYPLKKNRDSVGQKMLVSTRGHPTSCWLPSCPRGCWTSSWQPPLGAPKLAFPTPSDATTRHPRALWELLRDQWTSSNSPINFCQGFLFSTHEVAATKMNADSSRRGNMTWDLWLFCHLLRW